MELLPHSTKFAVELILIGLFLAVITHPEYVLDGMLIPVAKGIWAAMVASFAHAFSG